MSYAEAWLFWLIAPLMVLGALGLLFARKAVHAALCMAFVMVNLGAVSYTHLDVYKRQLVGGRVSAEDAYAYGKFARVVLGTNDVDFRARPHSAAETYFLATQVVSTGVGADAGSGPVRGVSYADLDAAGTVLLVGFEPEEESPIVFLRLRNAWRKKKTAVYAVAPFASRGLTKLGGALIPTAPGAEAVALTLSLIHI